MKIVIDADACPVKEEAIGVARRFGVGVTLVCNPHHKMREADGVEIVGVGDDPDEADATVVKLADAGDVVITEDYPLAALALAKGAQVLSTRGRVYSVDTIEFLLIQRHENQMFREASTKRDRKRKGGSGPKPFGARERKEFLEALERMLRGLAAG